MFRLWRRVFLVIKSMKYATTGALFLVLVTGLIQRSGKLLIVLTGTMLMLALVACAPAPTYTSTPIMAPYPKPIPAQGEKIDLSLSLVSGGYPDRVTAGENVTFFLEIRNTGNKTITNIRLSSIEPEGWTTDFNPSTIGSLSPENFQTLELNIRTGDKAAEGGYKVTLIADANEIRRVLDIWLTVEAPKDYWLWIGGIILLLVVAGFIVVYRRFGRE